MIGMGLCVLPGSIACAQDEPVDDFEVPVTPPANAYSLDQVRDDTMVQEEDIPAYYGLLDHASLVDDGELKQAALEFMKQRRSDSKLPVFKDMFLHPKEFRGKPLFLKGHVQQVQSYEASPNDYGIERLYEASLYIEDADYNLITVIFLEKPDGLPITGEMVDGVSVSGYFLKQYLYPSRDKHTRKAPLIMAHTVHVRAPSNHASTTPAWVWMVGVTMVFAILIFVALMVQRKDQRLATERQRASHESNSPIFDELKTADDPFAELE